MENVTLPVQLFHVEADCKSCSTGKVIENLPVYGANPVILPPPGEELSGVEKKRLKRLLAEVCESRGCVFGMCEFKRVIWSPHLNDVLCKMHESLRVFQPSTQETRLYLESFTREGTLIEPVRRILEEAGLVPSYLRIAEYGIRSLWSADTELVYSLEE